MVRLTVHRPESRTPFCPAALRAYWWQSDARAWDWSTHDERASADCLPRMSKRARELAIVKRERNRGRRGGCATSMGRNGTAVQHCSRRHRKEWRWSEEKERKNRRIVRVPEWVCVRLVDRHASSARREGWRGRSKAHPQEPRVGHPADGDNEQTCFARGGDAPDIAARAQDLRRAALQFGDDAMIMADAPTNSMDRSADEGCGRKIERTCWNC